MPDHTIARPTLALFCFALAAHASAQAVCSRTSIGELPLTELATAAMTYQGHPGGLYPGASNDIPANHRAAGVQFATSAVTPRDANGAPDPNGRIVMISVGMSNTSQEFAGFVQLSNADPNRSPQVVVVNGAQGGQDARRTADPTANFWDVLDQRLATAGVTPAQVQVVWLKQAVSHPTLGFPAHAEELRDLLVATVHNVMARYPNTKLCYLSSRIYGGYAPLTSQNPEPFAYESGFSVRWLIERQLAGDPELNFDASQGPVRAPWLAWGPYTWADGLTPRADGLIWQCSDFASDGVHPGMTGQQKVAAMLDAHFHSDPTATPWYEGSGGGSMAAAMIEYGDGCAGVGGVPQNRWNSLPVLGNGNFRVGIQNGAPLTPTAMLVSAAPASLPVVGDCALAIDGALQITALSAISDPSGRTAHILSIPASPTLAGVSFFAQTIVVDPAGTPFLTTGLAFTRGVEWRLGN